MAAKRSSWIQAFQEADELLRIGPALIRPGIRRAGGQDHLPGSRMLFGERRVLHHDRNGIAATANAIGVAAKERRGHTVNWGDPVPTDGILQRRANAPVDFMLPDVGDRETENDRGQTAGL